jgi:hypothetical protein
MAVLAALQGPLFFERRLGKSLGPYRVLSDNMLPGTLSFSPPWPPARSLRPGECDLTDSYCSLQEIPIMFYFPDSYNVRSGPGVSVLKKFQITNGSTSRSTGSRSWAESKDSPPWANLSRASRSNESKGKSQGSKFKIPNFRPGWIVYWLNGWLGKL